MSIEECVEMSGGVGSNNVAASSSTPLFTSSGTDEACTVKLRMALDDPYIGFDELIALQHSIIEKEGEYEGEYEEEQEEEVEGMVDEVERLEGGDETEMDKFWPCLGMQFKTAEEAYNFYNRYGYFAGFSIRRATTSSSKKKGGKSSVRFVCSKEGYSRRQKAELNREIATTNLGTPEREHGTRRTNCKASLRVKLLNTGVWIVSIFNENHNHDLIRSPSKIRNLRSHKGMTQEERGLVDDLNAHKMGTSNIYEYIGLKKGGRRQLRFNKKDVSNQIATKNRKILGVDVETTLGYFMQKQEEDPEFFYAIDRDDEGRARHIFWIDGRARRAYLEFGDVVIFDTTYNTNRYNMPLAPFIGVNHHRQSIFFGMALLRSEKEWNFDWLFRTWLKAMYEKHPICIITDQDPAMKGSISKVFPNTTHRCCQWHVMRKAREHFLKQYEMHPGLEPRLKAVINRSLTVPEFNSGWEQMLKDFNIENIGHWKVIWDKQHEWVPAYFRDNFFADMSTSQRSESMNAILKLWLDNHTSIYQFVKHVGNMIEGIWDKESNEDIKNINEAPRFWSKLQIEFEARGVYTRNNFAIFKDILKEVALGIVIEVEKDKKYEVSIETNCFVTNWVPELFIVEVDNINEIFSCNCKGFDFEGFLCQHAIKVMLHVGIQKLPKHYILRRWCKGANSNAKRSAIDRSMEHGESAALRGFRKTTIHLELQELEDLAAYSEANFQLVLKKIKELKMEMKPSEDPLNSVDQQATNLCADQQGGSDQGVMSHKEQRDEASIYLDPPLSQCKGRKKKSGRFKPPSEKIIKRRTCSYCHTKDAHNIRTCPKKLRDAAAKQKKMKSPILDGDEDEVGSSFDEESDE